MSNLTSFKRNVGVVGLAWSGKTVFLTSLIDHLKNHDPERFHLPPLKRSWITRPFLGQEEVVSIRRYQEVSPGQDLPTFNHERIRDALVNNGEWPHKTTDASYYRCEFERSDWVRLRKIDLTFIDFPGERFADCLMVSDDYGEWSDRVLKLVSDDSSYRDLAAPYLELQEAGAAPTEADVIRTYKETLARFALNYRPMISPSIFALDRAGIAPAWNADPAALAADRLCGLDEAREFAPLGPALRDQLPELVEAFAERYRAYRETVPDPLFRQLQSCHRLVVLVDVPGTLAANVGRLNDLEEILDTVLRACNPQRDFLAKVGSLLSSVILPEAWRPTGISRIAFVGTKSDMVRYDQVSNALALLKEVVARKVRDYEVKHRCFACSALVSTVHREGKLLGHPVYTPEGKRRPVPKAEDALFDLSPSDVPESWPEAWQAGQFVFPEVWPRVPKRESIPPEQLGINSVLDFLLQEDLSE